MTERLRIKKGAVEWREVEGEVVALDVGRSEYIAINPSGTVLWRELETGATKEELVLELVRTFDVEEDVATRDVEAFLRTLDDRGLLVR